MPALKVFRSNKTNDLIRTSHETHHGVSSSAARDLFHYWTFASVSLFSLVSGYEDHSEVAGPVQPIVAMVGENITLPCHLKPSTDASSMVVEWSGPVLNPSFVYFWKNGHQHLVFIDPSYEGRMSLLINNLKHGDLSLNLIDVKLSDDGTYTCLVPQLGKSALVRLTVEMAELSSIPTQDPVGRTNFKGCRPVLSTWIPVMVFSTLLLTVFGVYLYK
uniref:Ig-like domain-containing protein n=1 Tax=Anabas testudineus TaxID=64144 RepID=A0A3Q1JWP1_ANATE